MLRPVWRRYAVPGAYGIGLRTRHRRRVLRRSWSTKIILTAAQWKVSRTAAITSTGYTWAGRLLRWLVIQPPNRLAPVTSPGADPG